MKVRCYVIRGGLWGPDGVATSRGMDGLTYALNQIDGVYADAWNWTNWQRTLASIDAQRTIIKIVLIGYSGGGMMCPFFVRMATRRIALAIGYDPSPKGQIKEFTGNLDRGICYYNDHPMFLGLGGGLFTAQVHGAPSIDIVRISQSHLMVQFNQTLHARTIAEVKKLTQ